MLKAWTHNWKFFPTGADVHGYVTFSRNLLFLIFPLKKSKKKILVNYFALVFLQSRSKQFSEFVLLFIKTKTPQNFLFIFLFLVTFSYNKVYLKYFLHSYCIVRACIICKKKKNNLALQIMSLASTPVTFSAFFMC